MLLEKVSLCQIYEATKYNYEGNHQTDAIFSREQNIFGWTKGKKNNLAIILGKANRYVVVRTGCIPVGLILKGIYGSTSVTGDPPFLRNQNSWFSSYVSDTKDSTWRQGKNNNTETTKMALEDKKEKITTLKHHVQ